MDLSPFLPKQLSMLRKRLSRGEKPHGRLHGLVSLASKRAAYSDGAVLHALVFLAVVRRIARSKIRLEMDPPRYSTLAVAKREGNGDGRGAPALPRSKNDCE